MSCNYRSTLTLLTMGFLVACGSDEPGLRQASSEGAETTAVQLEESVGGPGTEEAGPQLRFQQGSAALLEVQPDFLVADPAAAGGRKAYFGDLHVHTTYSFDAFAFGTLATPYDAYRYAQGEPITHPGGFQVQLRQPADFYAVTDHAMFLGLVKASADTSTEFSRTDLAQPLHGLNEPDTLNLDSITRRRETFAGFLPDVVAAITNGGVDQSLVDTVAASAWADTVRAADRHYRPGEFTTFAGYEYTSSTDDRGNLHRNVIFRDTRKLPAIPFSRFHSQDPEGLWEWMDGLREHGVESLAIPHNSNGSNGHMFKLVDWAGEPIDDDYAQKRLRNEPLVEITQVKGTSETHPELSTRDEWADFEIMPYRVATSLQSDPPGGYVRDAWLRGLGLEAGGVANPYRFGVIGSSDTHTAAMSVEEDNFFAKIGLLDSNAILRGSVPIPEAMRSGFVSTRDGTYRDADGREFATGAVETWGAAGLAGVWAERNTRDAIYAAFRRKETFATSGPRLRVRLFAGYDYEDELLESHDIAEQAYAGGVTMGSDLNADGERAPRFLAWATRDPDSAALQRLQVVKGYLDGKGESQEQVYDVACSDGLEVNPDDHRCPDNGAGVNTADCSITAGVGATELKALWSDPDFDPGQRAFYYVRVLENPTCRWSTWDAVRAGVQPRDNLHETIQERAWSSPIWFLPAS